MKIRVGTRGSVLALAQTLEVTNLLSSYFPEMDIQVVEIKTSGDINNKVPINTIGGKGLFIKEIEEALLIGEVDLAVHSVKDIPAFYCDGLVIPCILKRSSPYDVFVSSKYQDIKSLPLNATVGTSSIRRKVQLNYLRPDLQVIPIRGNIDTRILKSNIGEFDGIVLAEAGLIRINKCNVIKEILDSKVMLSAVGQGAICVQCRVDDYNIINKIKVLNCHKSYVCVMAERSFLKTINGSCDTPLAALAQYVNSDTIYMSCMLSNEKKIAFSDCYFEECNAEKSGIDVGKKLINELYGNC
ncbi:hydroxymethylbilane synthase [Ehrlichia minasensis]|uniref:Porphobilinogen deaminase n=1 Tax=Ehrlichia minasensis TaxID=1242993 RepID=A0A4Q6IAQ2_9RICK|nr:hydroxymethylbilane synthase [Ehrlichia minasensis]RZB12378.1 hydroxymethylbilane synthase [Ehrlichia minasensis]CEI85423.1 Porphobilinogen deaminase (PBG) (Hy droxymethylbilane synthase) (HMBS) (Pre-uroporphyrinogen sy nthase) [Ehrlichia minasensis]